MRYLYYCNSAYQLLNILNLHYHRKNKGFENIDNYDGDLLMLNTFDYAKEIYEIIKKEKIFSEIRLIEKAFNKGSFHSILTIMDLFSPSFYMKNKYGIRKDEVYNRYDYIVTPKYSTVVDQIWRLNRKAKLQLIEDGIGSYSLTMALAPSSKIYQFYYGIMGVNSFSDYSALYLVKKDLYIGKNADRVRQTPAFTEEYTVKLRNLFADFINKDNLNSRIYWLSQFFNNRHFNEVILDGVLKKLLPYKDDVLFVQHPRKHLDNKYEFKEAAGKQIWELQVLNMEDIENRLFISAHSTACFTAKMLFDKEPYVILFYRMADSYVTWATDEFEQIVENFRKSYRDPQKVMIPETIEELEKCLQIYAEKTGLNSK